MSDADPQDPAALLRVTLASQRVHSAYLVSGPGEAPRNAALAFVRGLVCTGSADRPCEQCDACHRSAPGEPIAIDGTGKKGPLYRHVGDHPDLVWVERGPDDTRVRISQVRAIQKVLRLASSEGGRRAAVIADAEWLNVEAQNALLHLLEEPPASTTLVLVAASAAGLLATIRSRCQRVAFPNDVELELDEEAREERAALESRFAQIERFDLPALLDWAEEYRGPRAVAASHVQRLLSTGSEWLRRRVHERVDAGDDAVGAELDAFRTLGHCRRDLAQRNANPQMVAERALFAVREAVGQ